MSEKAAIEESSAKTIKELVDQNDKKLVSFTELKTKLESVEADLKLSKEKCESLQTQLLQEKIHNESSSSTDNFADVSAKQKANAQTGEKPSAAPKPDIHTGATAQPSTEPDVYLVGNSLTAPLKAKQLFKPLNTKIKTLDNHKKNLEGALEHLDECNNIKPKSVVLQVIENNVSRDQPEEVLKKLNLVVEKARAKFPDARILVVEPIGRGDSTYNRNVQTVRDGLARVVDKDCIIPTGELHHVNDKLFRDDRVHLKGKGIGLLCSAYKRVVYPCHGVPYDPDRREASPDRQHTSHRRETVPERNAPHWRGSSSHPHRGSNHAGSHMETDFFNHMRDFFMKRS